MHSGCNRATSTNSCTFCMSNRFPGDAVAAGWDRALRITVLKCGWLVRFSVLVFPENKFQSNGSVMVHFLASGPGMGM